MSESGITMEEWAGEAGRPPNVQFGKWVMAWTEVGGWKYGAKAFVSEEGIRRDPRRLDLAREKVRASVQSKLNEGATC